MNLELLILAVVAGFVLYQLYAVLGRRVGRQPEDAPAAAPPGPRAAPADGEPEAALAPSRDGGDVAALRSWDPRFDLSHFLAGSRGAYEMIVRAFAEGDRETLNRFVAPGVVAGFEQVIASREAEGRSEKVEFLTPPRADLDAAKVEGERARITVRFLAELRRRTVGPEGEGVDDQRTAELWTFERSNRTNDPNWILVRVASAEA